MAIVVLHCALLYHLAFSLGLLSFHDWFVVHGHMLTASIPLATHSIRPVRLICG